MSTIRCTAFLMLSVFALLLLSVNSSKSIDALTPVITAEEQELNIPEQLKEQSLTGKEKVLSWIIKRKIDREMRRQQKAERRQQGTPVGTDEPEMNGFALAAGIAGGLLVLSVFFPFSILFGVLATLSWLAAPIFGIIGLRQIKREPGRWRGKGWATFGVVLGVVLLVTLVLFLLAGGFEFDFDLF